MKLNANRLVEVIWVQILDAQRDVLLPPYLQKGVKHTTPEVKDTNAPLRNSGRLVRLLHLLHGVEFQAGKQKYDQAENRGSDNHLPHG
jgi:hypothetical protein